MKYARLEVILQAIEPLRLPQYKGSVIRGGFGLAFRRIACPFLDRECSQCLLSSNCVWSYVFNTPRPEGSKIMRKYETIPHPFVIEPPEDQRTTWEKGEELTFHLLLIGKAIDYLPYFILTFEQMAEQGLGPGRGKLKVKTVNQNGRPIYSPEKKSLLAPLEIQRLYFPKVSKPSSCVTIHFLTPTRIIYQGKMSQNIEFSILIRSLLRRIGLLAYFHDQEIDIDFANLIRQSGMIKTKEMELRQFRWTRYSRRQEEAIEMVGMVGKATYQGEIGPFLSYLRAGEILHIGKGTSFGMGKYKMEVK